MKSDLHHQNAASRRKIFVAYPYRLFSKEDYRRVFSDLEKSFDVSFVFADAKITNDQIFKKITLLIQNSIFGIYDISGWNPNVTLELGYAIGMGKPTFVMMDPAKTSTEDAPSDLRGRDRIDFGSYSELENGIRTLLLQELKPVTYGSVVCLKHVLTGGLLHSTGRRYAHEDSSGQQEVVAVYSADPRNEWIVRGPHATAKDDRFGLPVEHGAIIRLEHAHCGRYLHSHAHPSPITKQHEVTVFDPGVSDENDNWRLELDGRGSWIKWDRLRLIHNATEHALHSHGNMLPSGNQEVTCFAERDDNDFWCLFDQSDLESRKL